MSLPRFSGFNAVTRAIYISLELKMAAVKLLIIVVTVLQGKEKTEVYFFPTVFSTKQTLTLQFNSSFGTPSSLSPSPITQWLLSCRSMPITGMRNWH